MPGYNAQQIANNVLNGNNVAVQIGDTTVAFGQTSGHQVAMGAEQLYGIGTAKPQEVQQLRMSPAISIDAFTLTSAGLTLLADGQRLEYMLAGKSFDITVLDGSVTPNAPMFTYIDCKAQNMGQNIPANAPIRSSFSFLALDVLDNKGNSILDSGDNLLDVAGQVAGLAIAGIGGGVSG